MSKYDSILHMSRPRSKNHPPLSEEKRAAQFSPFAALTGYGDAIEETARLTDEFTDLNEDELHKLDDTLRFLSDPLNEHLPVSITCFVPDEKKEGGSYETFQGKIKKIDPDQRVITLDPDHKIDMDSIRTINVIPASDISYSSIKAGGIKDKPAFRP